MNYKEFMDRYGIVELPNRYKDIEETHPHCVISNNGNSSFRDMLGGYVKTNLLGKPDPGIVEKAFCRDSFYSQRTKQGSHGKKKGDIER